MKILLAGIVLSCFFITVSAQSKDLDIIKQINLGWLNSLPKKDTATLNKIFADDIILVNPQGASLTKKDILARIMEPKREYKLVVLDSLLYARVFGNAGIIIAKTTTIRKLNGVESILKICVMNAFEKRKGKWFVVASHNTLLDAK